MGKISKNTVYIAGIIATIVLALVYTLLFAGNPFSTFLGLGCLVFALLAATQGFAVIVGNRDKPNRAILYAGGGAVLVVYVLAALVTAILFAVTFYIWDTLLIALFMLYSAVALGLFLLILYFSGKTTKEQENAKFWEDLTLRAQVLQQRIRSDGTYKLYEAFRYGVKDRPYTPLSAKIDEALTEIEQLHLSDTKVAPEIMEAKINSLLSLIDQRTAGVETALPLSGSIAPSVAASAELDGGDSVKKPGDGPEKTAAEPSLEKTEDTEHL